MKQPLADVVVQRSRIARPRASEELDAFGGAYRVDHEAATARGTHDPTRRADVRSGGGLPGARCAGDRRRGAERDAAEATLPEGSREVEKTVSGKACLETFSKLASHGPRRLPEGSGRNVCVEMRNRKARARGRRVDKPRHVDRVGYRLLSRGADPDETRPARAAASTVSSDPASTPDAQPRAVVRPCIFQIASAKIVGEA